MVKDKKAGKSLQCGGDCRVGFILLERDCGSPQCGIKGIWSAISIAEALTLIMTTTFFVRQKDKYHYL